MYEKNEDSGKELNKADKMFFKFAGFAGLFFFVVILIFSYYLIFDVRIENKSNSKIIFYFFIMLILELIILTKSGKMITLVKKRTSDYITAFFLIFFQLYFLSTIGTFMLLFISILK